MSIHLPICLTTHLGNHQFVLYICVSITALQINSSVPFFSRFHIKVVLYEICFFFLTYFIVWQSVGSSTSLQMALVHSFLMAE